MTHIPQPSKKKDFMPLRARIYASFGINIFFASMMWLDAEYDVTLLEILGMMSISFFLWLFLFWEINNMLKGRKAGQRGILFTVATRSISTVCIVVLFLHQVGVFEPQLSPASNIILFFIAMGFRSMYIIPEYNICHVYRNGKFHRTVIPTTTHILEDREHIHYMIPFIESLDFEDDPALRSLQRCSNS